MLKISVETRKSTCWMTSDDIWRHLMTPLNHSVLSLFIFAVEFKFMSYPNDSTMKRRILFSVMCAAIAAGAFAQGQGQGLAGINEATSLMTSYFDPATNCAMPSVRCSAWWAASRPTASSPAVIPTPRKPPPAGSLPASF